MGPLSHLGAARWAWHPSLASYMANVTPPSLRLHIFVQYFLDLIHRQCHTMAEPSNIALHLHERTHEMACTHLLIAHIDDLCIYHWLFVLIIIPTERRVQQCTTNTLDSKVQWYTETHTFTRTNCNPRPDSPAMSHSVYIWRPCLSVWPIWTIWPTWSVCLPLLEYELKIKLKNHQ